LRIDRFALTANNVTYAAAGDMLKYWAFFPIEPDQPGGSTDRGLAPVWGFATVVASHNDEISVGERLYGFLPMATHVVLTPGHVKPDSLVDAAAHRGELPPIYNRYQRLPADADPSMDNLQALLQPLFATSYLLNDFFVDNNWFGAAQLVVASASSKTAIGLMQLAAALPSRPQIIGLTSTGNTGFVQMLGCCDEVVTYDALDTALPQKESVFVDIAGNADVRERVHQRLADQLLHSCAVGTSHWDKFRETGDMPGAKPRFFFAPAQAEKRRKEWGGDVLAANLQQAWFELATDSRRWLQVQEQHGPQAIREVWGMLADGKASPDTAHVLLP
jgi:hypothetical protein